MLQYTTLDVTVRTTCPLTDELLVAVARPEVHKVREDRIDEIADGVVRRVEHHLQVHDLVEDHDFDGERSVVCRPDAHRVVVELIRDGPQLGEGQCPGDLCVEVVVLGAVPAEDMQPLVGLRDHYRRPVHDVPLNVAVLVLRVDHDDLKGVDGHGIHDADGLVDYRVLKEGQGATPDRGKKRGKAGELNK